MHVVGLTDGVVAVFALKIIVLSAESEAPCNRCKVRGGDEIVLLSDAAVYSEAIGVVETVHADPAHVVIVGVCLFEIAKPVFAVNARFFEHSVPAGASVFRIKIKVAIFHARHDVRCAAAHALGERDGEIGVLLNENVEHFAEDVLLCHRFGGDVDGVAALARVERCATDSDDQHEGDERVHAFSAALRVTLLQSALKQTEQPVDDERQDSDEQTAAECHGGVVRGDAAIDRDAESPCADERCDTGEGDRHRHHAANAGKDHRHCQRQLDLDEHLRRCAAHAGGCFQDRRINAGDACVRVAHHRQEGVDRQRDHRCDVADAGEGNEKTEHRDRRDRVEKIDHRHRWLGSALEFADEDTGSAADDDGDEDRRQGDRDVFSEELREKIPAAGEKLQHFSDHGCSPKRSMAPTGQVSAQSPQCRQCSGAMTYGVPGVMQFCGQALAHFPQATQASVM